jgi:hypothetical protein
MDLKSTNISPSLSPLLSNLSFLPSNLFVLSFPSFLPSSRIVVSAEEVTTQQQKQLGQTSADGEFQNTFENQTDRPKNQQQQEAGR